MAKRKLCILMFILWVIPKIAFGDGKFFHERIPVGIPYQRAVLLLEDGTETLILQSKYKTTEIDDANSIGWVVPVPAVPELASMDADYAKMLFFSLSRRSQPIVVNLVYITILMGVIAIISILITKAVKSPTMKWWRITAGATSGCLLILLL